MSARQEPACALVPSEDSLLIVGGWCGGTNRRRDTDPEEATLLKMDHSQWAAAQLMTLGRPGAGSRHVPSPCDPCDVDMAKQMSPADAGQS